MSVYKEAAEVEVRDRRLGTIIEYNGTGDDLLQKMKEGHIKCPGRLFNQCSDCAQSRSMSMALNVRDAAVVSHAPLGCMTDVSAQNVRERSTAERQRIPAEIDMPIAAARMISTNIQEKDTVYGAADSLRSAIDEADRRFHPKTIFILSSCAAGIIGEDIESIAAEKEGELGYPVVAVYCEGFKSKTWSSGFDAVYHGALRKLVKPPKQKQKNLVNMFNFQDKDVFTPLLGRIGLQVNVVFPMTTTLKKLAQLSEAACSAHICETLATYIAAALEEKYDVPEVKTPPPYGIDWTDNWLREIGRFTAKQEEVEILIHEEHKRIEPELLELKKKLHGRKIYIVSGDTYAYNMANIIKEFDMQIVGIDMLHHDMHPDTKAQAHVYQKFTEAHGNMQHIRVCNKQPYQIMKTLQYLRPDFLLIRHSGLTPFSVKLGIPAILESDANSSSGYEGTIRMGRRLVHALQAHRFVDNVAKHAKLPYTDWWLEHKDVQITKEEIEDV